MAGRDLRSDRRRFLRALAALPVVFAAQGPLRWLDRAAMAEKLPAADEALARSSQDRPALAPTPDCTDDDEPTPAETEGPFFKPRSPLRTSLIESGMGGTRLVVTGRAFSRDCRPIPGALLDFWHADDEGEYDNIGFKLRGHQFTDREGRFRLETILPGLYTGRTRHIHVKVQPRGGRILTTQLYFPGEPRNRRDFLFRPDLLVAMRDGSDWKQAKFNFVLNVS